MKTNTYEFLIDVVVFASRQHGRMRGYDDSRREVGSLPTLWAYATSHSAWLLKDGAWKFMSHAEIIEDIYTYTKITHEKEMREYSEDPETWEFNKYDRADLASVKQALESLIKG